VDAARRDLDSKDDALLGIDSRVLLVGGFDPRHATTFAQ
jgi:hypothetical protein